MRRILLLLLAPVSAIAALPLASALALDDHDVVAGDDSLGVRSHHEVNASAGSDAVPGVLWQSRIGALGTSLGMEKPSGVNEIAAGTSFEPAPDVVAAAAGVVLLAGLGSYLGYAALAAAGTPLFSRITKHKVLDNEVRNRVFECIAATPGVTIKEVGRLLGIGWGTSVHHLGRLERERLVVSERHRQFRRYYKNGGAIAHEDKTAFAELKNATTERLASAIANRPGAGQTDLCAAVGISAPLAHKHLARLENAQLLTKQRDWRVVRYFPTDKLVAMLAPAASLGAPMPLLVAA